MKISILMCAYNSERTIETAIRSCLNQVYQDWELLVLDNNSPDNSRTIVEKYQIEDDRIKYYYSDVNLGWAKGTSELLRHATGDYMTFLAADDYFVTDNAFSMINCVACENDGPAIVFVRHRPTEYHEELFMVGEETPHLINLKSENRLFILNWLSKNWYFNSMFHFVSIRFLKETGIDFYRPYYADNSGMTEAILQSGQLCCVDNYIYALTMDTSQTRGRVCCDLSIINQRWRSVRDYIIKSGFFDEFYLHGIAHYILRQEYKGLCATCEGADAVDDLMNPVSVTEIDRYRYVESVFATREWNEAELFAPNDEAFTEMLKALVVLCYKLINDGFEVTENDWLMHLVLGGYGVVDGSVKKRASYSEEDLLHIMSGLTGENNAYGFGFSLFYDMLDEFSEEDSFMICKTYCLKRVSLMEFFAELSNTMKRIDRNCSADYKKTMSLVDREMEEMKYFLPVDIYNSLYDRIRIQ